MQDYTSLGRGRPISADPKSYETIRIAPEVKKLLTQAAMRISVDLDRRVPLSEIGTALLLPMLEKLTDEEIKEHVRTLGEAQGKPEQ